jgi:hypothetical protein
MGGQRGPDGVMGHHGGLFANAAGRGGNQPLLDGEQLRGGPAALLHRPVGHHRHRPLSQEPVDQLLELDSGGTGKFTAQGGDDVVVGEGGRLGGKSVRAGQPVEDLGHRLLGQGLLAVDCPVGHLADQGVQVHAPSGRLGSPTSI